MPRLVDSAGTLYLERERKRDALRVVHAVAAALGAGQVVAIFPEGTTSSGHGLLPFHANLLQAAQANKLVVERRIDPAMSEVFPWEQIPKAHMRMWKNEHKPGNMAVLVNAPTTGLRTFEDVIEESRKRFG